MRSIAAAIAALIPFAPIHCDGLLRRHGIIEEGRFLLEWLDRADALRSRAAPPESETPA